MIAHHSPVDRLEQKVVRLVSSLRVSLLPVMSFPYSLTSNNLALTHAED